MSYISFKNTACDRFEIILTDEHWSFVENLFKQIEQNYPSMKLETFYENALHINLVRLPFFLLHMYESNLAISEEEDEILCPIGHLLRNSKKRGLCNDYGNIYLKDDEYFYRYFCLLCVSNKNKFYIISTEDPLLLLFNTIEDLAQNRYKEIELKNTDRNFKNSWNLYDVPKEDSLSRILRILKEEMTPEQEEEHQRRFGDLLK